MDAFDKVVAEVEDDDHRFAVLWQDRKPSGILNGISTGPQYALSPRGQDCAYRIVVNFHAHDAPVETVASAVALGLIDGAKWRRQLEDRIRKDALAMVRAAKAIGIKAPLNP